MPTCFALLLLAVATPAPAAVRAGVEAGAAAAARELGSAAAWAAAPAAAPAAVQAAPAQPQAPSGMERLETPHYEIVHDGTPEQAREAALVLESSWTAFARWFEREPHLKQRLRVRITGSRERWRDSAWNDGADLPSFVENLLYSERTRAVYLLRQRLDWDTRSLLIHGACLQFLAALETKNADLAREWQAGGLALAFARHRFDGERLELMTTPWASGVDLPALALARFGAADAPPPGVDLEHLRRPEVAWSLAALCLEGGDARRRESFLRFALGSRGSKLAGGDALRALGEPAELARELTRFLPAAQQPFEVVGGAWEDRGGGTLAGAAAWNEEGLCVLREPCALLEARLGALPADASASAGFVLGYHTRSDFVLVRIEAPMIWIDELRLGRLYARERLPLEGAAGRERLIRLERDGPRATLVVDGQRFGPLELPRGRSGLLVRGTAATFRDVRWTPSSPAAPSGPR